MDSNRASCCRFPSRSASSSATTISGMAHAALDNTPCAPPRRDTTPLGAGPPTIEGGGGGEGAAGRAGGSEAAGGFGRDCRSNGWGVGQVNRNAATHLAGKLEIEFAHLFPRVWKEMSEF